MWKSQTLNLQLLSLDPQSLTSNPKPPKTNQNRECAARLSSVSRGAWPRRRHGVDMGRGREEIMQLRFMGANKQALLCSLSFNMSLPPRARPISLTLVAWTASSSHTLSLSHTLSITHSLSASLLGTFSRTLFCFFKQMFLHF